METLTYSHFPDGVSAVHIALFTNISNAVELRKRLVNAAKLKGEEGERERETVNYGFVDARLITSRLHIQTAVYQAILAHVQGTMVTKTYHSEILWALSPSHNISEAIKRFGVSDSSQALLVVRIGPPAITSKIFSDSVKQVVSGDLTELSTLASYTDWPLIRKVYKFSAIFPLEGSKSEVAEHASIDQLVVSSVAMKSVSA
ncbi:CGI-121-domain-containing protein [Hysterangium stoloniferum]|nr:CGI-121-domain-containing protein [Hysterangium stoloniferum]